MNDFSENYYVPYSILVQVIVKFSYKNVYSKDDNPQIIVHKYN